MREAKPRKASAPQAREDLSHELSEEHTLREAQAAASATDFIAQVVQGSFSDVEDDNPLQAAIAMAAGKLATAIEAVDGVARLRASMKMSNSRVCGIRRELSELQKVLSGYGAR